MRAIVLLSTCVALTACASDLRIYSAKQSGVTPVAGVPFHTPELYVREGVFKQAAKGGVCDPAPFIEIEALPLGPLYYANIDPAEFAKSGFAIKFNEKGGVSEISMNTEPSSGEALKSGAELFKAIAPVLGVAAAPTLPGANPACDAGPTAVKYTRFIEWQGAQQ